ncbi:MAG: thymidylate synthase [Candidatus Portnoybacteria bacterium]|nr:thymidylate synthase [Candidatus Portnoybacteria bacterium]
MHQFDIQYQNVLRRILNEGGEEYNERTGHRTLALPGVNFEIDQTFPLLTLRKIPIRIFVAEQIWFIMGSDDPDIFLSKYTKIWDDFRESDGKIASAYGYRMRKYFGRDQLRDLVNHLKDQRGSRHGVVVFWDPADDGLGTGTKKKNIPCPYTFTANIIENKLHLHLVIRSNDMMLGCPHDMAGFALMQAILAAKIGCGVGKMTLSISNAHIYDIHYEYAREIVERRNDHPSILFEAQENYLDRAEQGDDSLVEEIINKLQSQYNPMAPIKNMEIVL